MSSRSPSQRTFCFLSYLSGLLLVLLTLYWCLTYKEAQRGSSAETRKGIFLKLAKRDSKLSDSKSLIRGTSRSKQLFADYPLAQTCSHSEAKGLNVQQRDKAQAQPELSVTSCCASPTWQRLGSPEQPSTLAALTSMSHTYQGWDTPRTRTSQLLATLDSWSILFPWLSWCGLFFLGYLFLLLWALGNGANPCCVQKNKTTTNKQRTQALHYLLLALMVVACSVVPQDKLAQGYGRRHPPSVRPAWAQEAGQLSVIFRKQTPIWAMLLCHKIIFHEFQGCSRGLHCLYSV